MDCFPADYREKMMFCAAQEEGRRRLTAPFFLLFVSPLSLQFAPKRAAADAETSGGARLVHAFLSHHFAQDVPCDFFQGLAQIERDWRGKRQVCCFIS